MLGLATPCVTGHFHYHLALFISHRLHDWLLLLVGGI